MRRPTRIPPRFVRAGLGAWFLAVILPLASAQLDVDFGGSATAEFGVAIDGSLPVAAAELELRIDGEVGTGFFPDATFTASLLTGYDAATGAASVRLGDAYGTLYLGDLDLSVGQQKVFWGSTDAVNPVDVLNPRDMTLPLASEKVAVPMLRAVYHLDDVLRLEAVAVPAFTPSTPPAEAWRTAPSTQPQLPPGVTIVGRRAPDERRPEAELENVTFGGRATARFDGFDASVIYVRGFRHLPTMETTLVPTETPGAFAVQPVLRYDRVHVVGTDFSGTLGPVVVRGEAAYTFTEDPNGQDPAIGNPSLQAVLGAEYAIPSGPRAVVQAIYDWRKGEAGNDDEQALKAMTALSYQADARTQLELAWMQSFDGSGAVVPRATYTFAEGVTGEASAYVFYGAAGTEFGGWKENAQLRLGVAYGF